MKHLTYAELGEKIAKKIGKFETDLKSTEPDVRNTAKRNMPKLKQAMESLKQSNEQEKVIAEATETRNMMAKGGYMNQFHNGGKTGHTHKNYSIYDDYKASTDSLNELAFLEQQAELGKHTGAMANNYDHFKDRADYASYKTDMSPTLKKYYDDNIKRRNIGGQQGFYHSPGYAIPKKLSEETDNKGNFKYFSEKELKAKGTAEKAAKAKADKERAEYNKIVAAGGRNFIESKAYGGRIKKYHDGGEIGHTHKDAEFTYNEPDPNTHPAYRTKKQTDLELLEEYREARSAQAKAADPAWSGGFFGDKDKDLSKDKDFQQKLAWSKKVRKKMSPKLQKYYDDNVKLDKGHVLEIYGNPSTPFQTYNPDPFNGEILKARGGYMNRYAGGGYLPMGEGGLDIGSIDLSGAGGADQDYSAVQSLWGEEGGGQMDWMGLLKNGMGALSSFGGTKGLFGDDEVPTEKYTPEYNKAEEQALANLSQLEQQTNAAYALSQQDTSLDTKGQRMANEKARQRAQKTANVGGPEGFALQNAANNEARDRAMMIAEKKANQEAMLNSGQAKAAAGSQFTDKLGTLARERFNIGKSRQDQDAYAQDAYRKDAAGARNINRQTGADESEFAQMQSLMNNQQGVDAGTLQSLMSIFGDPAVQGMLGGNNGDSSIVGTDPWA